MKQGQYLGIVEYFPVKETFEAGHPGGLMHDSVQTHTAGIQLRLQGGQRFRLLVDKAKTCHQDHFLACYNKIWVSHYEKNNEIHTIKTPSLAFY